MADNYILLIENFFYILIAIIIFLTLHRRGRDRILLAIGWLFAIIGGFNLLFHLPNYFGMPDAIIGLVEYIKLFGNTGIFFAIAAYSSHQLGLLENNKTVRIIFLIGFLLIFLLIFIYIFSFDVTNSSETYQEIYHKVSQGLLILFFSISVLFVSVVYLSLAWQLHNEKVSMNYITTTGLGLGLMLVAIILREGTKIIAPINDIIVDTVSILSLGLIIIGAIFQTSSSMSPGFIYDAITKKAVPLALVRIFRATDNMLLESRIARNDGHYDVLLEPGEYKIEVTAKGYNFPSKKGSYRGETFRVHKPTVLALDISLDPIN
ncbi:MAG: carboxypeptidase-like regulatory domain-containing protein [bacterium]|nr:carboxypeptidase-like regulatory domain-containing protein [bacterium]